MTPAISPRVQSQAAGGHVEQPREAAACCVAKQSRRAIRWGHQETQSESLHDIVNERLVTTQQPNPGDGGFDVVALEGSMSLGLFRFAAERQVELCGSLRIDFLADINGQRENSSPKDCRVDVKSRPAAARRDEQTLPIIH